MTTYLVLKRSIGDKWMPGMILTDPIRADILVQRGYIQEVPEDYAEKKIKADEKAAKAAAKAEVRDEKAEAEEEERIRKEGEALLLANRPDAKRLAKKLGAPLDEVFELSDEEYTQGLELLTEEDNDETDPEPEPEPEQEPDGGSSTDGGGSITIGTPG